MDDDMRGRTKWPPSGKNATALIKVQASCDVKWKSHDIQVMRFFGKAFCCTPAVSYSFTTILLMFLLHSFFRYIPEGEGGCAQVLG